MSRYLVEKTKTTGQGWQSSNRYFENCGERSLGQFLSVSFLVAYYILPQYFGIRLPGFDLTAQRMLITILCLFLLSKESRKKMFWEGVRSCRLWLFMAGYLGICFYTAVLRFHIGTFLYPFIELLGAFLVIYVLREYLGSDGFLVLFRRMLLFLCVLGLVEAVMRKTPFAYLETIRGLYTGGMIRSGSYRIMGPANHSLAYGLILISGLPLLCIDEEKHCFTLFRHLPLLLLVVVNVFLTGSRSTLAVMGLELLLLTVLAPGEQRKKLLFTIVPAGLLILLLAFLFPNSPPGHYILLQLSTVVDEMFGNYLSRPNVKQPILTQYCDGRQVSCPNWMTQWGSQALGQQGYSTIEILRYYYGESIYINTAVEIAGVPSSWPGYDLGEGSGGTKVRQMQEQLNVIAQAYPALPMVDADGIFGPETKAAVEKFQSIFGLPVTGIVDYRTWYKISEIYVGVSRIAELA